MHQKRPHVSRRSGVGLFILATWVFKALSPASLTPEAPFLPPSPVFSSSPIRRWIEEYWRIFGYFVRNGLHFLFFFDFYIYVCVLFFSFFKLFILCERIYSWKSRKINFLIFFSDISRYLSRYVYMTGPLKERRRIHINIIGYK